MSGLPRVLVVEDEYLVAMDLKSSLRQGGYDVVGPVATVAAALATVGRERLDACILDINLKGEHSSPVALALKQQKVPVLVYSAYDRASLAGDAAFDGVASIGKSAAPQELLLELAALLKKRAAQF